MRTRSLAIAVALLTLAAQSACRSTPSGEEADASMTPIDAHVVDVVAEDFAFEAPDEIPSGWVTFRLHNEGEETHFILLSRLPEGKTYDEYLTDASAPINEIWVQIREGEIDKEEAGEKIGPAVADWYWTGVEVTGGPGLVAAGGVAQATVNLEPGDYVMECFMKTPEGEFHWVEGMVRPLTVVAGAADASEPDGDVRVILTTDGYTVEGAPARGVNRVEVRFAEQPEAGFGNDVHVVRLEDGTSGQDLVPWMDAFNVEGLQNPAPATFLGGTHERTAGHVAYFTVELEPGRYAWISEGPDFRGIVQEFTVE